MHLYRRNVPLLHTSTLCPDTSLHVISFTRHSPTLVLQATNVGVKRPGYKANLTAAWASIASFWPTNDDNGYKVFPGFFWAKELVLSSLASYSVNLLVSLYTLLATFCLGQWLLIWQPVTLPLLQTIQRSPLVSPWMYIMYWPVTVDSSITGVVTYVTLSKTTHPMSHMQCWLPNHLILVVGSSDMPTLTNLLWVSRNCPSSHSLTA